jgi:glycosyltransferase involved in cell wall biosynthesis
VAVSTAGMMAMRDVAIVIPARNEEWLGRTVQDIQEHAKSDYEVVVICDGALPLEPLPQDPRLTVVLLPEPIGQRAATNLGVRISNSRFVMKADAHVSFADGFDRVLIDSAADIGWNCVQIPAQKNLHVYSWQCHNPECGFGKYQGPTLERCQKCNGPIERVIYWKPRSGTTTTNWTFTSEPRFQYGGAKQEKGDIVDVMTSLGACFFMTREFFEYIGGLEESHGSWGSYGIEVACKAWLSGGRHVVNKRTHFSHFFRVGGIGFPYQISGSDQDYARKYAKNLWWGNRFEKQVRPLSWLVEKFWPVKGWSQDDLATVKAAAERFTPYAGHPYAGVDRHAAHSDDDARVLASPQSMRARTEPTKGLVYYTDNRIDNRIVRAVLERLFASGLPLVGVSLQPLPGVARNIVLNEQRSYLTMFRQILAGLEAMETDVAFLVEHDVLYADHFEFTPPRDDCYFYNLNVWKVDAATGRAITYETKQTSGLCANRQLLIEHYRKRVAIVEAQGYSTRMGFEPGSHRRPERIDDVPSDVWRSAVPNVDIRHDKNLTPSRWSPEQFRDQRNCKGWREADEIPGWGRTKGRFWEWLADVSHVAAVA